MPVTKPRSTFNPVDLSEARHGPVFPVWQGPPSITGRDEEGPRGLSSDSSSSLAAFSRVRFSEFFVPGSRWRWVAEHHTHPEGGGGWRSTRRGRARLVQRRAAGVVWFLAQPQGAEHRARQEGAGGAGGGARGGRNQGRQIRAGGPTADTTREQSRRLNRGGGAPVNPECWNNTIDAAGLPHQPTIPPDDY